MSQTLCDRRKNCDEGNDMTDQLGDHDRADARGEVEIRDDCLIVSRLRLCDADLTHFVAEAEAGQRPALVERALRVGLIALRNASVTVNVDYVQKEFARLLDDVEQAHRRAEDALDQSLRETFADEGGRLPQTLERFLGQRGSLPRLIDELFDEERRDSAIGRIRTLLAGYFDGDGAILAKLLDPARDGSPLHTFRTEMHEGLKELADRLSRLDEGNRARADERARGTAKGTDFEDVVEERLGALAGPLGDLVERTSTIVGDTARAKKGDFVLLVNPATTGGCAVRVAVEAKDRHLTLPEIGREIEAAKSNRRAAVALLVFTPETAPVGTAPLNLHGDDVLCQLDIDEPQSVGFEAAVRLARALAVAAARQSGGNCVDVEAVRRNVEALRRRLDTVRGMKTRLTSISGLSDEIRADLDGLRSELLASVAGIEGALQTSDGAEPSPMTSTPEGSTAEERTGAG